MIDLHNHIIYGVDDGAPDLETSLVMAEEAIRDGITHIVCTPHSTDMYPYPQDVILDRLNELRERLDGKLILSSGCEFHMRPENIQAALSDPMIYSINRKGYLLIEFPDMSIASQFSDTIFRLQSAGYKLIVAHPERYLAVHRKPSLIAEWIGWGCLTQVTASSLYGRFGKTAQDLSNKMLDWNWIHFLATDAHHFDWRPPHMRHAYEYVAKRAGEETALRLCVTNPQAAVSGDAWPEQPEPWSVMPGELNKLEQGRQQRGLWAKLFGHF